MPIAALPVFRFVELAGRFRATACATWSEADNEINLRRQECLFVAVDRSVRLRQLVVPAQILDILGLAVLD